MSAYTPYLVQSRTRLSNAQIGALCGKKCYLCTLFLHKILLTLQYSSIQISEILPCNFLGVAIASDLKLVSNHQCSYCNIIPSNFAHNDLLSVIFLRTHKRCWNFFKYHFWWVQLYFFIKNTRNLLTYAIFDEHNFIFS